MNRIGRAGRYARIAGVLLLVGGPWAGAAETTAVGARLAVPVQAMRRTSPPFA